MTTSDDQSNRIESEEEFNFDKVMDLDEIAAIISKGYEDIRASNPNMISQEDKIDELIGQVLRRESYRAFEQLMNPFLQLRTNDNQVDILLFAAQFAPYVPKIATSIQFWVCNNLDLSFQQLQDYYEEKTVSYDTIKTKHVNSVTKLAITTTNIT